MLRLLSVDESARLGRQLGVVDWLATSNVWRGLFHNPRAAFGVYGVVDALIFHNTVSARARELVILRVGWRAASEYVFCNHVRIARELGMSDEEILGVRSPEQCRIYSETDYHVIGLADELDDAVEVTPSTWAALEHVFTPAELVELVLAAGFWRTIAGFAKTAKLTLDDGVASWPEGRQPLT